MFDHRVNTGLVVVVALAWVGLTALGMTGFGFEALFVGLFVLFVYALQGWARRGSVPVRVLAFPLVPWIACWAGAFLLSRYHADLYAGAKPDLTILGFHPSFAWTVLLYWIGGVLTLTVGFVVRRDDWLSEAEWEQFRREVGSIDEAGDEEVVP